MLKRDRMSVLLFNWPDIGLFDGIVGEFMVLQSIHSPNIYAENALQLGKWTNNTTKYHGTIRQREWRKERERVRLAHMFHRAIAGTHYYYSEPRNCVKNKINIEGSDCSLFRSPFAYNFRILIVLRLAHIRKGRANVNIWCALKPR